MRARCQCCWPKRTTVRFWDRNLRPYREGRKHVTDDEHMCVYYMAERARAGRLTKHEQIELGHRIGPLLVERIATREDSK